VYVVQQFFAISKDVGARCELMKECAAGLNLIARQCDIKWQVVQSHCQNEVPAPKKVHSPIKEQNLYSQTGEFVISQ
jgi:hypothetical protein